MRSPAGYSLLVASRTVNLLLFERSECHAPGQIQLTDRRFDHLKNVLKVRAGETLRVGEVDGEMGDAVVVAIDEESVHLRYRLSEQPPKPLSLTLIIGLPRPRSVPRILRTATMLGIKRIIFVHAHRVEKPYWSTGHLAANRVRSACLSGLEQAMDTCVPVVSFRRRLKPFVEDEILQEIQGKRALLAHPYADNICPVEVCEPVVLAVGPEGGWIDDEVMMFEKQGFESVRLSSRILALDIALPALCAKICSFSVPPS